MENNSVEKLLLALENVYIGMDKYNKDSNVGYFDADTQLTRDTVEKILLAGQVTAADIAFIRSLLPEIESWTIRTEIEECLTNLSAEK